MEGAGDFVRIDGNLTKEKYVKIFEETFLPAVRLRFPNRPVKLVQDFNVVVSLVNCSYLPTGETMG